MRDMFRFIAAHKLVAILLAAVLAGVGYRGLRELGGASGETRYVLASVTRGTIVASISGSGQVSAVSEIAIKPKASGDVVYVGVRNGEEVTAGKLLLQLDARDAQRAVRDAAANLESAKLSLAKLVKPADTLALLQAENALAEARESRAQAGDDRAKAYEDGFSAVANAFLDLPTVLSGLDDTFFDPTIDRNQDNVAWYADQTRSENAEHETALRSRDDFTAAYAAGRAAYEAQFNNYKSASRASGAGTIRSLVVGTYDAAKLVADAVKAGDNYIDFVEDALEQRDAPIPAIVATHQADLDAYTGTLNSNLSALLAAKRALQTADDGIVSADRAIAERTESLAKLKTGPDALDIQSAELAVRQRENALQDAEEKRADYVVRAPFDGIVATLDAKKGDSVSSGASLGTLITRAQFAEISLNEVDVAQIAVGQKATLTFDAVPGLTVAGRVAELDTVGTVSQGVVTYVAKVEFDSDDVRVKPGMSATAAIVTEVKQNVLTVPNGAVKTQGDASYVELLPNAAAVSNLSASAAASAGVVSKTPPARQEIEIGISNEAATEIVTGLAEGDQVIVRTIKNSGAQNQTQQAPSFFGPPPGARGGSGGFRAPR